MARAATVLRPPRPAIGGEFLWDSYGPGRHSLSNSYARPRHPRRIAPPVAESGMPDLLMLGLAALLFGGALLYVFVCERL